MKLGGGKNLRGFRVSTDSPDSTAEGTSDGGLILPDQMPSENAVPVPASDQVAGPIDQATPPADDIDLPDKRSKLEGVYSQVQKTDPNRAAQIVAIKNRVDEPENFIDKNLDHIQKAVAAHGASFFKELEEQYPGTSKWLLDPKNMAVSHDDLSNVASHEGLIKSAENYLGSLYDAGKYGAEGSVSGLLYRHALADEKLAPKDPDVLQRFAMGAGSLAGDYPFMLAGGAAGATAGATAGAVAGTPGGIPGIGIGIAAGGIGGAGVGGFGLPAALKTAIEQKIRDGKITSYSDIVKEFGKQGLVGLLTAGVGATAKAAFPATALGTKTLMSTAAPLAAEVGTMTVAGKAVEGKAPTWGDLIDSALQVGALHSVTHLLENSVQDGKTQAAKEFYTALGNTAEASKLRERLPEGYKDLVHQLTVDGPVENIYVPAEAAESYFQSKGIDPAAAMEELGVSKSYAEAKSTGGSVEIPLSTWASKIAGTEHYQGLADDVKFHPEDLTVREVNQRKADIQEQVKSLLDERKAKEQAQADIEAQAKKQEEVSKVRELIQEQLKAAGLSKPETDFNPQIHEAFFNTMGKALGVAPEELAQRFPLAIGRMDSPEASSFSDQVREPSAPVTVDGSERVAAQAYKQDVLQAIRSDVEQGSVEKGNLTYDQDGNVTGRHGAVSSYPDYFSNKGYTKKETLRAIDKHLEGKELTERQAKILDDLYHSSGYDKDLSRKAPEPFLQSPVSYNQSEKVAPPFYSKLIQTVEQKMGGSASKEQINGMLKEIKPEERKWLGLDEFLKGKEKISKQELLEFLRANQLDIQEIRKTEPGAVDAAQLAEAYGEEGEYYGIITDDDGNPLVNPGPFETEEEAVQAAQREYREKFGEGGGKTKYDRYTLPGGENYREVLFTLPELKNHQAELDLVNLEKEYRAVSDKVNGATKQLIAEGVPWSDAKKVAIERGLFTEEEAQRARDLSNEYTNRKSKAQLQSEAGNYRSSHWDEKNVLAHTRLSDRVDAEGKKVLHIEEIQSDWHQEGRKAGYREDGAKKVDISAERTRLMSELGRAQTNEERTRIATEIGRLGDEANAKNAGVPDAPFKKTWHEFVLKRLIREAAEKGYDKIAWTPGEQQAERYDLSKKLDSIIYHKRSDGTFDIIAHTPNGDTAMRHESLPADKIEDYVGKELAQKITNGEGRADHLWGNEGKSLSGLDLKVGGEGMKGFYDKIIPEFLNKFGKKFGAKVGETEIKTPKGVEGFEDELPSGRPTEVIKTDTMGGGYTIALDGTKETWGRFKSEADAQKQLKRLQEAWDSGATKLHSLDITPKLKDAAIREGFSLFQGAPKLADFEPRGRIRIGQEGYAIDLFKNADRSTFLHETGHYFLDVMGHIAGDENAPQQIKDDFKTILDWMGVKSKDEIGTEEHEKFARGFEQYLMEGKAPSLALTRAFNRFRKWLTSVYHSVQNLNVDMSDDVRGVMDRMLASQEEIERAQKSVGMGADSIEGIPPELQAKIQDLQSKARDQAESALLKEQMKETTEKHKEFLASERERLTKEATDEVADLPLYKAMDEASLDIGRDSRSGSGDDTVGRGARAGTIAEKFLAEKLSVDDAGKFEALAEVHGFGSGEELAQAMILAEEGKLRQREISMRVEAGMAPHADLMKSDAIKAEALKAIHSEKMTELLALEREAMSKLVHDASVNQEVSRRQRIEARVEAQAAKEQAREILAQKPIKEATNASKYVTAERNAAVKVAKSLAKKDYEAAAEFKRQQMLNHAIASEAMRNKTMAEKSISYLSDFAKRGNDLKDMPYGFMRQIDQLLSKSGFKDARGEDSATLIKIAKDMAEKGEDPAEIANRTGFRQDQTGAWVPEALPDFVARVNDNYYALSLPESVMAGATREYGELTLQELKDLRASVKTIADVGKKFDRYLGEYKTQDIKQAAAEFKASVAKNFGTPFAEDLQPGSRHATKLQELLAPISRIPGAFDRMLDTILTTCHKLDGLQEGPAKDNIYRPLEAAEARKNARISQAMKEMDGIFAKHYDLDEFAKYKDTRINVDGRYFTKSEILSMALNWGNEGNRQRLMDGFGFDHAKMERIFQNLGKKDWTFAQDVWNHLNGYWPEIAKLEMEINGVEPKGVEPAPFENEHGKFEGGYYPIAYDMERTAEAYQNNQSRDALYKQFSTAKAHTDQGHAQARASAVNRPLLLDLSVLRNHHEDVIHDLEFRRAVIDVNRFLSQKDTKSAIVNALGVRGYAAIGDWLKFAAGGASEPMSAFDKAAQWFRFRTTFFNLGYRIVSAPKIAVENMVNLSSELGMSGAARAIKDYYFGSGTHEMVVEKSEFMKLRSQHLERDLADIQKKWEGTDVSSFKKFAFFVHAYLDQGVSFPLWADTYNRAMAEHGVEKTAILQADESVKRTFMSGGAIDQAAVMRGGEKMKALTTAYGFQSMMWNRFSMQKFAASQAWAEGNHTVAAAIAARSFIYTFALPAVTAALTRELTRNTMSDNEDERKKRMAATLVEEMTPLKFVPVLRDISPYFVKKAMGEHASLTATPLEEAAKTLIDPLAESLHALGGNGVSQKFPEKVVNSASLLAGVPKEINDVVFNFLDWSQNNGEATWRDLVSRKTKK